MVTSDTYKRASEADPARHGGQPQGRSARHATSGISACSGWKPSRSGIRSSPRPATWTSTVGGPSFGIGGGGRRGGGGGGAAWRRRGAANRRGAYMIRGFSTNRDVMPNFLQAFDVDDGRAPCPMRTQTVTAPQGLFMMNSEEIESASAKLGRAPAEGIRRRSQGRGRSGLPARLRPRRRRPPRRTGRSTYLENDPARLKGFAWLLFNLDEFIYVR